MAARTPWLLGLGAGMLALATYWPARGYGFVLFDDSDYILNNPHVTTGLHSANVAWAFQSFYASNWHPLTWISHMADCALYGVAPAGHHLTSVLLHALNAGLLFAVLFSWT